MTPAKTYDIALVGAGPAGVAAAVAAAGSGRRVLLLDAWNRIGGAVTAGMHRSLCGLYSQRPSSPLETLNDGVQREVVERLLRHGGADVAVRQMGRVWTLDFPTCCWETGMAELCRIDGVDVRLGSRVTRVHREAAGIVALDIEGDCSGVCQVGVVVDCTGEGKLLRLAGADTIQPAPADPPSLAGFALRLDGLDGDPELLRLQVPYAMAKASADGSLPAEARFTMFHPGPDDGQGICKLAVDVGRMPPDRIDDYAQGVLRVLRREVAGCGAARIVERSPRILPRSGYRLAGRETVCDEDVLTGRQIGSGAVHAWWPIESWRPDKGPVLEYPPEARHYDIPPQAMHSRAIPNPLACGACLSATASAAASLRAAGICLATGDAAGRLAASLCVS